MEGLAEGKEQTESRIRSTLLTQPKDADGKRESDAKGEERRWISWARVASHPLPPLPSSSPVFPPRLPVRPVVQPLL